MATAVIMPKQGQSVESCIITKWHKKPGDKVKTGDILFSYETDKASFEEEAKEEGTLLAVFFEEGDDVECLLNVCVIGEEGEDYSQFAPKTGEEEEASPAQPEQKEEPAAAQAAYAASVEQTPQTGEVKISPRAKNLAAKTGADIRFAQPTGASGRIIERDIQKVIEQGRLVTPAAAAEYTGMQAVEGTGIGGRVTTADLSAPAAAMPMQPSEAPFEEVKLSNIRKIIAKSMHQSLAQSAQLTLNTTFDASDIIEFRKKLKEKVEELGLPKITINDIIVYVVSRALLNHKELNAHFLGDTMRLFSGVHVGIACDTPRGLMVPTLFNADKLSLSEISVKSKELTSACREGTINPDLLTGGTFTVTNLGTLGVESFTPVLNPPQTGILGVCGITERTRNDVPYPAMGLSLTFDHRAVDGAPSARFLQEVVKKLENFSLTLAF